MRISKTTTLERRGSVGALFLGALGLLCSFLPGGAQANLRSFSPGTLIIPMDACYQAAPDQPRPAGCTDGKSLADDGAVKAYGLVYRLLQKGVPVSVASNPGKLQIDAPDFTIDSTGSGGVPVQLFVRAGNTTSGLTSNPTITYRGAPFLIDSADAANARALLAGDPDLAPFTTTAIHVAAVTFSAPLSTPLRGAPSRVALVDPCNGVAGCTKGGLAGSEGIPLMRAYLRRAGLDQPGDIGQFGSPGRIADVVTIDDIGNRDALSAGKYSIVWLPHYAAPALAGPTYALPPGDLAVLARLTAFVGSGGVLLGQCAAEFSLEGGNDPTGVRFSPPAGVGNFLFTTPDGGYNNLLNACYPGNAAGFQTACVSPLSPVAPPVGRALKFGDLTSPFVQIGDFGFFDSIGATAAQPGEGTVGTVANWDFISAGTPNNFQPNVSHLISSQDSIPANDAVDLFSLASLARGQVLYLGGHTYADPAAPSTAGMRLVLNSLLFATPQVDLTEQTRSGPVVADSGKFYIGTYRESPDAPSIFATAADAPKWSFPQVLGHLREYPAGRFSGTEALGSGGEDWDAATRMPAGPQRTVYTQLGGGAGATFVDFSTASRDVFLSDLQLPGANPQSAADALIDAVRAGGLGGIDHSTPALIPPSGRVLGGMARPTVIYAGARDGQLHAFAVAGGGVDPGTELWSFLPKDQLARLRLNTAGVDASPNVRDLFDDWDGTGIRAWRTTLAVPEGAYGTSVQALDVTDPLHPALRWQRGTDALAGGVVLGNARGATWAEVNRPSAPIGGELIIATNLPGGQGLLVAALAARDGSVLWTFSTAYTRTLPGSSQIVPNEMPGPPAVVDSSNSGAEDRVYVADFEGKVWELSAVTGQNLNGTAPIYDVGPTPQGNVQPIGAPLAVYRDLNTGHLTLLAATGGADWAAATDAYAVYAIDVDPMLARRGAAVCTAISSGRIFAAPTIAGNDVYLLASVGNLGGLLGSTLGDSGTLLRVNLSSHQVTLSADAGKGQGAPVLTPDGKLAGVTVRDVVVVDNTGADNNHVLLSGPAPLAFRAWLEPL